MQEAPAPAGGGADALADLQSKLSTIASAEGLPEEAQAAFSAALEAFSAGVEAMQGGGSAPQGPVAPEAGGARGAVPASPAGVRP